MTPDHGRSGDPRRAGDPSTSPSQGTDGNPSRGATVRRRAADRTAAHARAVAGHGRPRCPAAGAAPSAQTAARERLQLRPVAAAHPGDREVGHRILARSPSADRGRPRRRASRLRRGRRRREPGDEGGVDAVGHAVRGGQDQVGDRGAQHRRAAGVHRVHRPGTPPRRAGPAATGVRRRRRRGHGFGRLAAVPGRPLRTTVSTAASHGAPRRAGRGETRHAHRSSPIAVAVAADGYVPGPGTRNVTSVCACSNKRMTPAAAGRYRCGEDRPVRDTGRSPDRQ